MTICVIHPKACEESATLFAKTFGWELSNPFAEGKRDYRMYDGVFNYGCNRRIYAKNIINKPDAVARCISKTETFKVFQKAGIPTVPIALRKLIFPRIGKPS